MRGLSPCLFVFAFLPCANTRAQLPLRLWSLGLCAFGAAAETRLLLTYNQFYNLQTDRQTVVLCLLPHATRRFRRAEMSPQTRCCCKRRKEGSAQQLERAVVFTCFCYHKRACFEVAVAALAVSLASGEQVLWQRPKTLCQGLELNASFWCKSMCWHGHS